MGAEFVRGRVCQGPSLLGAEMSRNRSGLITGSDRICFCLLRDKCGT